MSPSINWYEMDEELTYEWPDDPDEPTEILTTSAGVVWWTAAMVDTDVED